MLITTCTNCGHSFSAPAHYHGKEIKCVSCRGLFSALSGDERFFTFSCPICKNEIEAAWSWTGNSAPCPKCNVSIEIPSPPLLTKPPVSIKTHEVPQTIPEKKRFDFKSKFVLRKPGGMIWGIKGYTQTDLIAAIKSGAITTEWQASDGMSDWKVGDLVSGESVKNQAVATLIASSNLTSQIYLLKGEEQLGPFSQDQIVSMYQNGQIQTDCSFWFDGLDTWHPVGELVRAEKEKKQNSISEQTEPYMYLGVFFALIGLILVFYFLAVYDPSVELSRSASSFMNVERVNNIGKMQTKQIGVIIGCCSTVLGFGLLMFSQMQRNKS